MDWPSNWVKYKNKEGYFFFKINMEMTPQIQKEDKEGTDRLHIPSLWLWILSLTDTFICHEAVTSFKSQQWSTSIFS